MNTAHSNSLGKTNLLLEWFFSNMDTTYVKQSSFDKLTAGWFNWEETAYWARMISPWVSSASSMRQNQHVWIPTVQQEYGSSCQLQADKCNIDTNEYRKPAQLISSWAPAHEKKKTTNKLTGNSMNVLNAVNVQS